MFQQYEVLYRQKESLIFQQYRVYIEKYVKYNKKENESESV